MINFLVVFFTLFIQFGTADIVPFDYSLYEENFDWLSIVSSLAGWDLSGSFIGSYHQGNYPYIVVPYNFIVDNYDEPIITYLQYFVDDNQNVIGYRVSYRNVRVYSRGARGGLEYFDYIGSNFVQYDCYFNPNSHSGTQTIDALNIDYLPYVLNDVPFVINGQDIPINLSGLSSLGSLSVGGHSSFSPFEEINTNGVNWSGSVSGFNLNGHTYNSVIPSVPDPSSIEQNLLQQIINNTGHTVINTGKLGESLNNINTNIIQGISALYNAISGFNDNFVSSYIYDQEEIEETIGNSSFYAFASSSTEFTNTLIDKKDVIIDMVENMQDISDFVLYIDLRNWSSPVYSDSSGNNVSFVKPYNQLVALDFSFLQETKSLWQPLLLGLLYFGLFMSIYFDLPNILKGANR